MPSKSHRLYKITEDLSAYTLLERFCFSGDVVCFGGFVMGFFACLWGFFVLFYLSC